MTTNTGAQVHEVAALTQAGLLNGVSTLSASRGLLVLSDSINGTIWLLNTGTGAIETLATNVTIDDFAIDVGDGYAYLAGSALNSPLRVHLEGGEAEAVYGRVNETVLPGPTSVAIGRMGAEKGKAFVTTNYGLLAPVRGVYREVGELLRLVLVGDVDFNV